MLFIIELISYKDYGPRTNSTQERKTQRRKHQNLIKLSPANLPILLIHESEGRTS